MSEAKKKDHNENEVNPVSYTKAGLLENSAAKSGDETVNKTGEQKKELNSSENTPKISKEKSIERDRERPIH